MTRDVPPLSMRATFQPSTVNVEKRTVDVTWTTGARVLRGFWERYWEELSLDPKHVRMERLNNGAPLLDTHRMYNGVAAVLGVVESARLEKGRGVATVRFAKAEDDPEADKIFRKVADGIIQNISVGYSTYRLEKVEDGEDKLPVYRATDWEPFEISVVPVGADDGAGTRGEPKSPTHCIIVTRGSEEQDMDPEKTPDTAAPAAEKQPTPPTQDEVRAQAEQAERTRIVEITEAVRAAKIDGADTFLADHVKKGTKADEVRKLILAQLAQRSEAEPVDGHVRIEGREDEKDKFIRGVSAAVMQRAGVVEVVRGAQKKPLVEAQLRDVSFDPGEFRGIRGFRDLAIECLSRAGVKNAHRLSADDLFSKALGRAGYNTTTDFPVVLANVMHKTLLGAFAQAPDSWRRFCAVKPANDFRQHNFYRRGLFGTLDSLTEGGEFKTKSIPDGERAPYQVGTKGNIIGISRQALVNDDMGAFNDLGAEWGRSAGETIESDVYALLALNGGLGPLMLDGTALFAAGHANIGVQAALAAAAIDADAALMAAQTGPGGVGILDLQPAVLLVPRSLRGTAQTINDAQYNPDRIANKGALEPNTVRGLFRDVVATPRLAGTRRYLFADPGTTPCLIVAFLDGREVPELASQEGFRVDGIEWKVRLDHGVAAVEYRTAVTNAG